MSQLKVKFSWELCRSFRRSVIRLVVVVLFMKPERNLFAIDLAVQFLERTNNRRINNRPGCAAPPVCALWRDDWEIQFANRFVHRQPARVNRSIEWFSFNINQILNQIDRQRAADEAKEARWWNWLARLLQLWGDLCLARLSQSRVSWVHHGWYFRELIRGSATQDCEVIEEAGERDSPLSTWQLIINVNRFLTEQSRNLYWSEYSRSRVDLIGHRYLRAEWAFAFEWSWSHGNRNEHRLVHYPASERRWSRIHPNDQQKLAEVKSASISRVLWRRSEPKLRLQLAGSRWGRRHRRLQSSVQRYIRWRMGVLWKRNIGARKLFDSDCRSHWCLSRISFLWSSNAASIRTQEGKSCE